MAAGLSKVIAAQGKNSKLGEALGPLVNEVTAQLASTKTTGDKSTKAEKLQSAQDIMQKIAEKIAARGKDLISEARMDKTNLLMGVLLSRKNKILEEQYAVLEDPQFHTLPVVKFVDAQKNSDMRPLIVQAAEYLDHPELYEQENDIGELEDTKKVSVKATAERHSSAEEQAARERAVDILSAQAQALEKRIQLHQKQYPITQDMPKQK